MLCLIKIKEKNGVLQTMIFLGIKHKLTRVLSLSLFALMLYGSNAERVFATGYSASFQNADIDEFINIIGKNLHKTIILAPNVRGKITVRSYDQLNEKQYYQFFLNVLEVYGFAVIEMDNGIIKVITSKDATNSGAPVVDGDSKFVSDEMITRVVPLTNVSGKELAPLLRKLNDRAGGGNVVYYDPSNMIMLTGRAVVINGLVEIIKRVDKAGDQNVDIIPLKFSNASEMIDLVESIQKTESGISDIFKPHLVADERTNSVIIAGEAKARAQAIKLVKSLDSKMKHNSVNTRVFYLQYATASEVVSVLNGLSGSISNSSNNESDDANNSQDSQNSQRSQNSQSSQSSQNSQQSSSTSMASNLSIQYHTGTNSIIISAEPEMMASLSSIISQLDIRQAQVLVEAIIVEVSEDDGVNLNTQFGSPVGGTQFNDNGVSTGELAAAYYGIEYDDDFDDAATALSEISGGIFGVYSDSFAVIIQAVSTLTTANILSTPSITTLDNQEASFIVGDEVPVITGTTSGVDSNDTFSTVEREEVGIKLKVTPQINKGDTIKLLIEQEVSSIQGSTSVDIIFATRAIKTTVMAKSGATIILGGLISEELNETVEKVPFLGDLPLIGWFFRSTISSTEKSNLMVFLRATILRDDESMGALSKRKYQSIRALQVGQDEDGVNLMPDANVPVLPEWSEIHPINPNDFSALNTSKKVEPERL
ncbi:MAG: general secretion pathway protein D [Psychromonas sp.]